MYYLKRLKHLRDEQFSFHLSKCESNYQHTGHSHPIRTRQNSSLFRPFISQAFQLLELYVYNQYVTTKNLKPREHFLFTYLYYRLKTTQPRVNEPPPAYDSPETFPINRNPSTLQEPNPACFAIVIPTHLEHLDQLTNENFGLHQKLDLYCEFFIELQPFITNLKLCEETYYPFNIHLHSIIQIPNLLLTDAQH